MKKIATLAAAIALALSAHATEFFSGNELLSWFESADAGRRSAAGGYVLGIADAFDGDAFCLPDGVVGRQLTDVVVRFLRAHPENRSAHGGSLAMLAMNDAWPCKRKPTSAPSRSNELS